jgi:hypothetical protein
MPIETSLFISPIALRSLRVKPAMASAIFQASTELSTDYYTIPKHDCKRGFAKKEAFPNRLCSRCARAAGAHSYLLLYLWFDTIFIGFAFVGI